MIFNNPDIHIDEGQLILEQSINEFLAEENIEVINILQSQSSGIWDRDKAYTDLTITIFYKEKF
ncbi:MAG: hypothetical protein PHT02_00670 [Tissierellia bacterium]|nr:hypothetical protein [Tissierellia bacterium]